MKEKAKPSVRCAQHKDIFLPAIPSFPSASRQRDGNSSGLVVRCHSFGQDELSLNEWEMWSP